MRGGADSEDLDALRRLKTPFSVLWDGACRVKDLVKANGGGSGGGWKTAGAKGVTPALLEACLDLRRYEILFVLRALDEHVRWRPELLRGRTSMILNHRESLFLWAHSLARATPKDYEEILELNFPTAAAGRDEALHRLGCALLRFHLLVGDALETAVERLYWSRLETSGLPPPPASYHEYCASRSKHCWRLIGLTNLGPRPTSEDTEAKTAQSPLAMVNLVLRTQSSLEEGKAESQTSPGRSGSELKSFVPRFEDVFFQTELSCLLQQAVVWALKIIDTPNMAAQTPELDALLCKILQTGMETELSDTITSTEVDRLAKMQLCVATLLMLHAELCINVGRSATATRYLGWCHNHLKYFLRDKHLGGTSIYADFLVQLDDLLTACHEYLAVTFCHLGIQRKAEDHALMAVMRRKIVDSNYQSTQVMMQDLIGSILTKVAQEPSHGSPAATEMSDAPEDESRSSENRDPNFSHFRDESAQCSSPGGDFVEEKQKPYILHFPTIVNIIGAFVGTVIRCSHMNMRKMISKVGCPNLNNFYGPATILSKFKCKIVLAYDDCCRSSPSCSEPKTHLDSGQIVKKADLSGGAMTGLKLQTTGHPSADIFCTNSVDESMVTALKAPASTNYGFGASKAEAAYNLGLIALNKARSNGELETLWDSKFNDDDSTHFPCALDAKKCFGIALENAPPASFSLTKNILRYLALVIGPGKGQPEQDMLTGSLINISVGGAARNIMQDTFSQGRFQESFHLFDDESLNTDARLEAVCQYLKDSAKTIPCNWNICTLALCPTGEVLISSLRASVNSHGVKKAEIANACIFPSLSEPTGTGSKGDIQTEVLAPLDRIIEQAYKQFHDMPKPSLDPTQESDFNDESYRRKWWEERHSMDKDLEDLLRHAEGAYFGHAPFRRILVPNQGQNDISDNSGFGPGNLAAQLGGAVDTSLVRDEFDGASETLNHSKQTAEEPCVILVLDETLQRLPFESMEMFEDTAVTRVPSLPFALVALLETRSTPMVDGMKVKSVIDPEANLPDTASTMGAGLDSIASKNGWEWKSVSGNMPSLDFMSQALSEEQGLFLYCGHGAGLRAFNKYQVEGLMSGSARQDGIRGCRASVVLMGCSSGKLQSVDVPKECPAVCSHTIQYEPEGIALSYTLAGSPCVVGNLWDVTDRDIDSFPASPNALPMLAGPVSLGTSMAALQYVMGYQLYAHHSYENDRVPYFGLPAPLHIKREAMVQMDSRWAWSITYS